MKDEYDVDTDTLDHLAKEQRKVLFMDIYLLEALDRWDEFNPWELIGYTSDIVVANRWVSESPSGTRRKTKVDEYKEEK